LSCRDCTPGCSSGHPYFVWKIWRSTLCSWGFREPTDDRTGRRNRTEYFRSKNQGFSTGTFRLSPFFKLRIGSTLWQGEPYFQHRRKTSRFKSVSDHLIPGRWEEVRQPSAKELKATKVIAIPLEEATAKIRTGGPVDDKADYELDIWAGELPVVEKYGSPIADEKLAPEFRKLPKSIVQLINP